MARAVVSYDKDLPEIPDRPLQVHLPPTAYLRRKEGSKEEFEIVEGRRPSRLLMIDRLRTAVDRWRSGGDGNGPYAGASATTKRLLQYWFDEDHLVDGAPWRYYFGQREAIETLVFVREVLGLHDTADLVRRYAIDAEVQTARDGSRSITRQRPEDGRAVTQLLPEPSLPRYAVKMATGSGKTIVMAMAMVWSHFHRRFEPGSDLSTNFLLLAPNVIVYQRLERDFAGNRIFHELPLIPPEWRGHWRQKVILRQEAASPDALCNLFVTNIQQLYESAAATDEPGNPVGALLGPRPKPDLSAYDRPLMDVLKGLPHVAVLNDEAHHVHDESLRWHAVLTELHHALPAGLSLWLDFSATPKDQTGLYFPWVICDYPLAQAVEDRIVKSPIIVHTVEATDPTQVTRENAVEAYRPWLTAALARWRVHDRTFRPLGLNPVLFVMAESNAIADAIADWLASPVGGAFKPGQVLTIHIDNTGEVRKGDLDTARRAAMAIDEPNSPIRAIVSVLMLREGWDVRNVSVVLGLRPFTAQARILPEQAVGRGLRLMQGVSPDRTQTLEVVGTRAFEDFVRELETEGVGIPTVGGEPRDPVDIYPVREKLAFDITIPVTKPAYEVDYRRLGNLNPLTLQPIFEDTDLDAALATVLRMEFMTTETEIHHEAVTPSPPPIAQEVIASITRKTLDVAKMPAAFAQLYPLVKVYLEERCFGRRIDLEEERVRLHLAQPALQDGIVRYLGKQIAGLAYVRRPMEFESGVLLLSETPRFTWRRRYVECTKTVFNRVATYNPFESYFADWLDQQPDVVRFAALEAPPTHRFRVDYLKRSGGRGWYEPDWVVVQTTEDGETHWIVETKGREWENTLEKDAAMRLWCRQVSEQSRQLWRFVRVNQQVFERQGPWHTWAVLVRWIEEHE